MSWGMVGSAAVTAGAGYLASKGGGGAPTLDIPAYETDKYYTRTQDKLEGLGGRLSSGDIPDWLKGITEAGGSEFQDMMRRVTGSTSANVQEQLAARGGGRGGLATKAVAGATSKVAGQLGWQDYQRSLQGRESLFGRGTNLLSGVRSAGLQESEMKHSYQMQRAMNQYQAANAEHGATGDMWGGIMESGIGLASNLLMPGTDPGLSGLAGLGNAGGGAGTGLGTPRDGNLFSSLSGNTDIPMGLQF